MSAKLVHNKLLLLLIGLTIFYVFSFQYIFTPISGLFIALSVGVVILTIFNAFKFGIKRNLVRGIIPFVIFFLLSLFSSLVFSSNIALSMNILLSSFEYFIFACCIYLFINNDKKNIYKILTIIFFSVFTLSVGFLIKAESNYFGALELSQLNNNSFSSYCFIGVSSAFLLVEKTSVSNKEKIMIILGIPVIYFAQFLSASRRGSAVLIFMLIGYLLLKFLSKETKVNFKISLTFLTILFFVVVVFYGGVLMNSLGEQFVVLKRFAGEFNYGDEARSNYQKVALELFRDNPLFGNGFGAVQNVAGLYSHSLYYELLSSTGLVGFFVLNGTFLHYFICCFQKGKTLFDARILCLIIASLFFTGVAVTYVYDFDFYILTCIICSFIQIFKITAKKGVYKL